MQFSPIVRLVNASFTFNQKSKIFSDISFDIKKGEIVAIIGRTGIGKSTLLRCVSNLEKVTAGEIEYSGTPKISYMFQNSVLLPWLSVEQNILLPAKLQNTKFDIEWLLKITGLKDVRKYHPSSLSGGMQKRVSFAQALVTKPDLLLLDEPYSSLDEATRRILYSELREITTKNGIGVLIVTHNLTEVFDLASKIIILTGDPATATTLNIDTEHQDSLVDIKSNINQILEKDVQNYIFNAA